MSKTKLTIGADPEFFLRNIRTQLYVSAHNIVPGDKKNPVKLPDGSTIQADGTAVEFGIEPAETPEEFAEKIKSSLNEIRKIIPDHLKFVFSGCIMYDATTWNTIPDSAKELGCDPDWTAHIDQNSAGYQNTVVDPGRYRTGAGHIHLGWTKDEDTHPGGAHFMDCSAMIYALDRNYQNIKSHIDDTVDLRENFYGRRRAFRCKPYGVEYRSPSNEWLKYPVLYPAIASLMLTTAEGVFENKQVRTTAGIQFLELEPVKT